MDAGIIVLFAAVLIIGALLFALITFGKKGSSLDIERYRSKWLAIEQSISRESEVHNRMAIIDADKLVDQALKDKGFKGNTMGDRLKSAKAALPHRDNIWQAHKLRNRVAHEPDVKVSYDVTRRALAQFKQTLKDLGAI